MRTPASNPHTTPAAIPARNRTPKVRTRFDESAVTRLKTPNPRIADTRTARRRNPRVNAISGTAPTTEPNAYAVTNCPAPETDTDNPDRICTSSPAGMVSVVIAMKPAIASADNPASGSVADGIGLRQCRSRRPVRVRAHLVGVSGLPSPDWPERTSSAIDAQSISP